MTSVSDREKRGQAVDEPGQFRQAERAEHEAGEDRFPQRQAARDEGPHLGPAHQRVGVPFEGLVEDRGADGDERGAEQRVAEQGQSKTPRLARQITGQRGEQHHHGQARLGQLREIGGEGKISSDGAPRWDGGG